jgi:hypothetical protein
MFQRPFFCDVRITFQFIPDDRKVRLFLLVVTVYKEKLLTGDAQTACSNSQCSYNISLF